MRLRFLLVLCCALFALTATATIASAGEGGNSEAAKACQKGGWETLAGADGAFKNEGDCVAYAAQGGEFDAKTYTGRALCESFGGTFAVGVAPVVWTCNNWPFVDSADREAKFFALAAACFADGGDDFSSPLTPSPASSRCSDIF
jgi:hypothetical protein